MKINSFLKGNDYFLLSIVVILSSSGLLLSLIGVKWEGAMFPVVIVSFMLLMGFLMLVDGFKKKRKGIATSSNFPIEDFLTGVLVPGTILLIACFLLQPLGYYIVSFLLVFILLGLQDRVTNGKLDISPKRIKLCFSFSLGVTLFMYFVFRILIGLPTPRGILGF